MGVQMQHEIKIVVLNPAMNGEKWAADVYKRDFDPRAGVDKPEWERVQCGVGGLTRQDAFAFLDSVRAVFMLALKM